MSGESELLARLLSSEVKGDLLVLFRKNPGLIDTVEGVARRIGRVGGSIKEDVNDLTDLGILRKKRIGSAEVLSLDHGRDKEVQEAVANYLRNLKRNSGV